MKKYFTFILPVIFIAAFAGLNAEEGKERKMLENIHWLGQDGFKFKLDKIVVYIDPYKIKEGSEKADFIFITHEHRDHFSPEDISRIVKKETVLVSCKAVTGLYEGNKQEIKAGETFKTELFSVSAVPAYNINKKFHPKESGKLGYIIEYKGLRIYHAGDTDIIPEMKEFKCNIALLPVSGTYVMTAEEAVEAAKILKPDFAIPMHYGAGVVGTVEDAKKFKEGLKAAGTEVVIKEKE